MRIEYQQEQQDITAASAMMAKKLWVFLWSVIIVIVLAQMAMLHHAIQEGDCYKFIAIIAAAVMTGIVLSFVNRRQRRRIASNTILRRVTWEFLDSEVKVSTEVSQSTIKWEAFIQYREGKKIFLLQMQKNSANFIPKRVLSPAQVDEFRALMESHNIKRG